MSTTIRLSKKVKRQLDNIKKRKDKSYNSIIKDAIGIDISTYALSVNSLVNDEQLDLILPSLTVADMPKFSPYPKIMDLAEKTGLDVIYNACPFPLIDDEEIPRRWLMVFLSQMIREIRDHMIKNYLHPTKYGPIIIIHTITNTVNEEDNTDIEKEVLIAYLLCPKIDKISKE